MILRDPYLYLSIFGAVMGIVPAVLVQQLEYSRRPVFMRVCKRIIPPLATTLAIVILGAILLWNATTVFATPLSSGLLVLIPFLLVWALLRSPLFVAILLLVLLVLVGAIAVVRGLPRGESPSVDSLPLLSIGETDGQEVARLTVEQRDSELALTLSPVAPFLRSANITAEHLVSFDESVTLTAVSLLRPAPLWFLGARSLLLELRVRESAQLKLQRLRVVPVVVEMFEDLLADLVFTQREYSIRYPVDGTYLQEGSYPIRLHTLQSTIDTGE